MAARMIMRRLLFIHTFPLGTHRSCQSRLLGVTQTWRTASANYGDSTPDLRTVAQRRSRHDAEKDNDESSSSSDEDENVTNEKHIILKAALPFVHELGWTMEAIGEGAQAAGYPSVASGLFPAGAVELVHYFYIQCNENLVENMQQWVQEKKRSEKHLAQKEFLQDALWFRLQLNTPYIAKWAQAMGLLALPQNATISWKLVAQLVDDIWYHAGDRSPNFGWYTKRIGLASIYKSSELFLLQDKSEGFLETKRFQESRLDDANDLSTMARRVTESTSTVVNGCNDFLTILKNMAGANSPR